MSPMDAPECVSLWAMLGRVPDHRRREGQRYPLAGLLMIAVAALLSGRRDQLGIVHWGRQLSGQALQCLGIERGRVPAPSVWCELFQGLDMPGTELALGAWVRGWSVASGKERDGRHLGHTGRVQPPAVRILAALSRALGGLVGQLPAPDGHEITAALTRLKTLPLPRELDDDAAFVPSNIGDVIADAATGRATGRAIADSFGSDRPIGDRLPRRGPCQERASNATGFWPS